MKTFRARLGVGAILTLAIAAAFWAGRVTLKPSTLPPETLPADLVAEVSNQSVGRVLNLNVTVSRPRVLLAPNALTGVVTAVSGGSKKEQGSVLYRVAGVPVRAIAGSLPFYREMQPGMRGGDVAQLRNALVAMKYLESRGDTFDAQTAVAVRAWQRDLSIPETGAVPLGEVVAVRNLRRAILVDRTVSQLGAVFSGGEKVVYGASGDLKFSLIVSETQARLVPQATEVTIARGDSSLRAIVAGTTPGAAGEAVLTLTAPGGGPVCRSACSGLAARGDLTLSSRVHVVPEVTGPAVPVAAITTRPDGSAFVILVEEDGDRIERPVSLLGSQDGVAVVDGLKARDKVLVFAAQTPGQAPKQTDSSDR